MLRATLWTVLSSVTLAAVSLSRLLAAQGSATTDPSAEPGAFKPVVEAPLPEGFPAYTPVGEIEVKKYPAYRKAEASGQVAFWTLFQHIKTAGISMTAPVEMTYGVDGPPAGREQKMAFLYGDRNKGNAGQQGSVQVVDVPAATVVSIGQRGGRSEAVLRDAEQRLRKWLDENKSRYEASGPVRVMGYNSPFIPRDRQFFEVQIPIRDRSGIATVQ